MLPGTRRAFVALAAGQVIMVGVMTAAPLHLHMQGSGTGLIGAILSAHTFGMFAFSPLTAALTERFGAPWVAASGLAVLALASTAGAVTVGSGLTLPLLVLGYGWNLCFIAGSATLAAGTDPAGRLAVEGRIDALVRSLAAVAGVLSTCCCRRAAPASLPGSRSSAPPRPRPTECGRRLRPHAVAAARIASRASAAPTMPVTSSACGLRTSDHHE